MLLVVVVNSEKIRAVLSAVTQRVKLKLILLTEGVNASLGVYWHSVQLQ